MFPMMSALNVNILLMLHEAATSATFFSVSVIFFAEWLPFLVVASVVAYEFFVIEEKKVFLQLIILSISPVIALTIAEICKFIIPSPRPFADGLGIMPLISVSDPLGSFPSAHAAFFGALGTAIFFQNKQAGKWYLLAALLIGISRIATGVHWPSDIIAGLLLGILVSICQNFFQRILAAVHLRRIR
jgi:undecaprenyl-diphosphatase